MIAPASVSGAAGHHKTGIQRVQDSAPPIPPSSRHATPPILEGGPGQQQQQWGEKNPRLGLARGMDHPAPAPIQNAAGSLCCRLRAPPAWITGPKAKEPPRGSCGHGPHADPPPHAPRAHHTLRPRSRQPAQGLQVRPACLPKWMAGFGGRLLHGPRQSRRPPMLFFLAPPVQSRVLPRSPSPSRPGPATASRAGKPPPVPVRARGGCNGLAVGVESSGPKGGFPRPASRRFPVCPCPYVLPCSKTRRHAFVVSAPEGASCQTRGRPYGRAQPNLLDREVGDKVVSAFQSQTLHGKPPLGKGKKVRTPPACGG